MFPFSRRKKSKEPFPVLNLLCCTDNDAHSMQQIQPAIPMEDLLSKANVLIEKLSKHDPEQHHSSALKISLIVSLWIGDLYDVWREYESKRYNITAAELMKEGHGKTLYEGMFRVVAETIFMVSKILVIFSSSHNSILAIWD